MPLLARCRGSLPSQQSLREGLEKGPQGSSLKRPVRGPTEVPAQGPNGRAHDRTAYLPERRKMMQVWADYMDQLKASA